MKLFCSLILIFFAITVSAQVDLNAGLVAYYPMNGSFADYSGNGNNGTAKNGVTFTADRAGHPNSAALFDGVNDWISIPASPSITFASAFSVLFNFKTTSTGTGGQVMISKAGDKTSPPPLPDFQFQIVINYAAAGPGMYLATNHNGLCSIYSLADHYLYSGTNFSANQWFCVAVIFDKGVSSIYIDGTLVAQNTVTSGSRPTKIDSCINSTLRLGDWWQGDPHYFSGAMDDVRFYSRAVNQQEVTAYCNNTLTAAPVTLSEFTASATTDGILLNWTTAAEYNNAYFIIEHSTDGINFIPIGKANGAGSSNAVHHYSFIHQGAIEGKHFYRLAQTDINGSINYSTIVSASFTNKHYQLKITPNPVKSIINLNGIIVDQLAEYSIISSIGSEVQKGKLKGNQLSIDKLTKGYYMLRITQSSGMILSGVFIKE